MVAARRAGYMVSAVDAFADKQTLALADKVIVVDYDEHGFNAAAMLNAVHALNVKQYVGFIYGSGFEAQPEFDAARRVGCCLSGGTYLAAGLGDGARIHPES